MGGNHGLVDIRHTVTQHGHGFKIFLRHGVAHRVGNIDRRGTGLNRRFHNRTQKIRVGAGGVFGRPFDIIGIFARARDAEGNGLHHFVRLHLQLVFHMHRAGGNEGMDARVFGVLQSVASAVDIFFASARQPAHLRVINQLCDLAHAFKVTIGRNGKTGLNNVDAHCV